MMKQGVFSKKICVGFSIFLLLVMPLCSMAQGVRVEPTGSGSNACGIAERDAEADVSGMLWLGAGCLFGPFGVGAGYLIEPSPSAARLLGKPPEYVAIYTDCYKRKGRSLQTNKAIVGCIVGTVASVALYAVVLIIAANTLTEIE